MWINFELLVISILRNRCKQSHAALWRGLLVPTIYTHFGHVLYIIYR
jgi:hypothetical protein